MGVTRPIHPILIDLITKNVFGESADNESPHYAVSFMPFYLVYLRLKYLPKLSVFRQFQTKLFLQCKRPKFHNHTKQHATLSFISNINDMWRRKA